MCCWSPGFAGRSCDFFPVPLQHPQTQFLPSFLLPSHVVVPSFEWMRFIGEKIFSGSAGVQLVFHSTQPLDYYFIPVANKSKQRNWGALSLSLEVRRRRKRGRRTPSKADQDWDSLLSCDSLNYLRDLVMRTTSDVSHDLHKWRHTKQKDQSVDKRRRWSVKKMREIKIHLVVRQDLPVVRSVVIKSRWSPSSFTWRGFRTSSLSR